MAVTVVHEGVLQLGKKPTDYTSKDWKRFLFILKHHQDTKRLFLDYYKDSTRSSRRQKREKKGSIEVLSYCHFSLAHNCSYQFPLKIQTAKDGEMFLAASTFESMNTWYNCLQKNCYLVPSSTGYYEYSVVPQSSPSIELIGASGDCLLAFTPQKYMVCAQQSSKQVFGAWPYGCLRKYWGDKEGFGFICGRRAPRGEGEYKFQTAQGEDIFRVLERLIKVVSARPQEIPVLASVPPNLSKGASTHKKAPSDEASASAAGVDSRPQHPLPPHMMHQKHSELRKRLSLAEPLPPTPDQVSNKSSTLPRHPVRGFTSPSLQLQEQGVVSNTDVSDTSPAYFTASTRLHQQNQQSPPSQGTTPNTPPERRAPYPRPLRSPPVSPTFSNEQEEDTYSHTTHEVPLQFTTRNASFKMVRGNNIYNGLMRSDSLGSKTDRMRRESNSSSLDEDSMAVYDLAYRPGIRNPRELVPVREGEYESVGDAARQLRQLKEQGLLLSSSPGSKHRNNIDGLSFGEKLRHGEDAAIEARSHQLNTNEGQIGNAENTVNDASGNQAVQLMNNPMYGSRENILADCITDTASSIERERERSVSNGSGGPAEDRHTPPNDMERSMVMNPTYSECNPRQYHPKKSSRLGPEDHGSILPGMNIGGAGDLPGTLDEPLSPLEDSMVDNPMYGGRSDLAGIGNFNASALLRNPNLSQARNSYTETDGGLVDNLGEQSNDNHDEKEKTDDPMRPTSTSPPRSQKLSCSPESPVHKSIPIVRSDKGYTKIDKPPGSIGESSSPPPPLPPRLYSEGSTESNV